MAQQTPTSLDLNQDMWTDAGVGPLVETSKHRKSQKSMASRGLLGSRAVHPESNVNGPNRSEGPVQGLIALNISGVRPTCAQLPRSTLSKNRPILAYVGAYASSNSRSVRGTRGAEAGDCGGIVGATRFVRPFSVSEVVVGNMTSLEGEGTFGRAVELSREQDDVLTTPLLPGLEMPLARIFRDSLP